MSGLLPRRHRGGYFFLAYSALGAAVLVFLKLSGRDAWITKVGQRLEAEASADQR